MNNSLFMIHGMWGGPFMWDTYRHFFEDRGFHCITPTLRYHDVRPADEPDPRLGTTSVLDYVRDLERHIDTLDSPPILMGHSMGGLLAQLIGSRREVSALVLITPASPAGILGIEPSVFRTCFTMMARWRFWAKPVKPTFNEAAYGLLNLLSPERQRAEYDRFVYESGRALFEIGFWLMDGRRATHVDESRVTCPVLVVAGSYDRITPAGLARKIARKYDRGSTYKEFPDHAHWLMSEPQWEEPAEYILGWIQDSAR